MPAEEGTDKYPTTFYFATSLESLKNWIFSSNIYQQRLPISLKDSKEFNQERSSTSRPAQCLLNNNAYQSFEIEILSRKEESVVTKPLPSKPVKKLKNFRLFFAGIDLFETEQKKLYKKFNYKDFAVVEVTFANEKIAEEVTRGFARKYKVKNSKKSSINVLGDSVDKTFKTTQDLQGDTTNYYSFAYTGNSNKLEISKNWDNNYEGEKLSSGPKTQSLYTGFLNDKVKGYLVSSKVPNPKLAWASQNYHRWGHLHFLQGSSIPNANTFGAMVVDNKGNLLGIKSNYLGENSFSFFKNDPYSAVVPLRSTSLPFNKEVNTPEYDLIVGVTGQKTSYKQQLETHILSKAKTWLSVQHNWTAKAK